MTKKPDDLTDDKQDGTNEMDPKRVLRAGDIKSEEEEQNTLSSQYVNTKTSHK